MNSHSIALQGRFELPEPAEINTTYTLTVEGDIISIKKKTQDDGSFEFIYAYKPLSGEIVSKTGKVTTLQKKSSQSAKLRAQLIHIALERGMDSDFAQNWYEDRMVQLRHFLPEVLLFMEQLAKDEDGL